MNKIISFLLTLSIILSLLLTAVSCSKPDGNDPGQDPSEGGDTPGEENPPEDGNATGIILPPYKDYGRNTVDFNNLTYKRPDIAGSISAFGAVTLAIEQNQKSFDELLSMIIALEGEYNNIFSMRSIANIYMSRDSKNEFWCEESSYIEQNLPSYAQAIDNLFVAAANSEHAERFEDEYFGDDLISNYRDGGSYTDELVALLEEEAELESRYNSISTANTYITYGKMNDTVDNILAHYRELYGENSSSYAQVVTVCESLYYYASQDAMVEIYVDIVKVRRKIADELSLDSYAEFAYDNHRYDYSISDTMNFLNDISTYIAPIYSQLAYSLGAVLDMPPEESIMYTEVHTLMNTLSSVYKEMDTELSDIYSYMLQHKLYDITHEGENRAKGAFTTYIGSNNSPYIFAKTNRNLYDYTTVAHEFGHFVDYFVSYGEDTSLDLSEVYSTALEYLTLIEMKDDIPDSAHRYLLYYQIDMTFQLLMTQGFYANLEHEVYALPYDQISEESISLIAYNVGKKFSLNALVVSDLSNIMIPHLIEAPLYVQSYCTSMAAALQIYIMDVEDEGAGLEAYKALLHRPSEGMTFEEALLLAGIESPFEKDVLRNVANEIYRIVTGGYYFPVTQDDTNAA